MEHLYNPDQMSEQEIKATFVARQALVDRLVTLIERQPEGAGVRHAVLVAPRGMGKTTMLLMVQFAVADRGLAPPWLAIRFPEELYGVTDLADFWLETLDHVSHAAGDDALAGATEDLKRHYPDSETLQEGALVLLRDWCRRKERRLLLLVDNFHQILNAVDEQQAAALRRVLMNEGWVMILGAAPSFFKEASHYDEPLYNFFQIEHLERLTFADMRALLLQRAAADGLADFEKTLDANTTRLRVLEYFTGGNVRLALMLYRVITRSDVSEMRRGLELLLDQVTPFYKDKTEALPAQQRKILDQIARTSGRTHEGVSPSEIAKAVRLTPQTVSAQLKRLTDAGYVQPANLRGRSTFYTLSEPLYSLWYQMRFGRDARERMGWLVNFLKGFYTVEELGEQSRHIGGRFHELVAAGLEQQARDVLEHMRWVAEAIENTSARSAAMAEVIVGHLALNDVNVLKNELRSEIRIESFSLSALTQLVAIGCVTPEEFKQIGLPGMATVIEKSSPETATLMRGVISLQDGNYKDASEYFNGAIELDPSSWSAYFMCGISLVASSRLQEAQKSFDLALALDPQQSSLWAVRAAITYALGDFESADTDFMKAEAGGTNLFEVWKVHSAVLSALDRSDEALEKLDKALKLDPNKAQAEDWLKHGGLLTSFGRLEEALPSYDKALEIDNRNPVTWIQRGQILAGLNRHQEALDKYDEAMKLGLQDPLLILGHGSSLATLSRFSEALEDVKQLLVTFSQEKEALAGVYLMKAVLELMLGNPDTALQDWGIASEYGRHLPGWIDLANEAMLDAVQKGHGGAVREWITHSHTEEQFFPLARALDYLASGNEALIEKLTPEMRPIVEAVVAKLRPAAAEEQGGCGV